MSEKRKQAMISNVKSKATSFKVGNKVQADMKEFLDSSHDLELLAIAPLLLMMNIDRYKETGIIRDLFERNGEKYARIQTPKGHNLDVPARLLLKLD